MWFDGPLIFGLSALQLWLFAGPILSGFIGALAAHWLNARRDRMNHALKLDYESAVAAREVRRDKLLQAYELIDKACPSRRAILDLDAADELALMQDFDRGIALVKLFGDKALNGEIDLLIGALAEGRGPLFNERTFMNHLPDRLRSEYGLDLTRSRYGWTATTPARDRPPANGG